MSNKQNLIPSDAIATFVQQNLINSAEAMQKISELVASSSDLAVSAFFSTFECNIHFGISDMKNFNLQELEVDEPKNRIMKSLHKKVWYAFHDFIQEHLQPATAEYFNRNYLQNEYRLKGLGCPNQQGLEKALIDLAEMEQCAIELSDLKPLLLTVTGGELDEKMKLKNGTFEQKARLIAKLANLRIRLNNLAQPVHYAKDPETAADEIYSKVLNLKANSTGDEVEIIPKVQAKFFANGNIDLKYHYGFAARILKEVL